MRTRSLWPLAMLSRLSVGHDVHHSTKEIKMIRRTQRLLTLFVVIAMNPMIAVGETDLGIKVFRAASGAVVGVRARDERRSVIQTGSGVVVAEKAVLTNCHVIEAGSGGEKFVLSEIEVHQPMAHVRPRGSFVMKAEFLADIGEQDLCLLYVEGLSRSPVATIAPFGNVNEVLVGEEICAIGNGMGHVHSIRCGVVSQIRSCEDMQDADFDVPCGESPDLIFETDLDASPGDSGGGVFSRSGLIGIMTFQKWEKRGTDGLPLTAGPAFFLPIEWVRRSHRYGKLLDKMARNHATRGDFDKAKDLAAEIYDDRRRVSAYLYIVKWQLKVQDITGALDSLARTVLAAEEAYVGGRSYSGYVGTLSRIAFRYSEAGRAQIAGELLRDAFEVAEAAFKAHEGDWHRYKYDHHDHAQLLVQIAWAHRKIGNTIKTRQILAEALRFAKDKTRSVDLVPRAKLFRQIACLQAKVGGMTTVTRKAFEDTIRSVPRRSSEESKIERIRHRIKRCEERSRSTR